MDAILGYQNTKKEKKKSFEMKLWKNIEQSNDAVRCKDDIR